MYRRIMLACSWWLAWPVPSREVAQGGELGFYAVLPGGIGRGAGDLGVVRRGPCADPGVFGRGQVRAEVVGGINHSLALLSNGAVLAWGIAASHSPGS